MMGKGGGIISVTLGKLGGKRDEPMMGGSEPSGEPSMAFLSASDELFDAIKSGDKGAFAEKLKSAIRECVADYEDQEGSSTEKGEEDKSAAGY